MNKYTRSEPTTVDDSQRELFAEGELDPPTPQEIEPKDNDRGPKQQILNNPLPLTELMYGQARVVILDWLCEVAATGDTNSYNKQEIADHTGIARPTVSEHMHIFEEMGIVEAIGDARKQYRIPEGDGRVIDDIIALNHRLGENYHQSVADS